MENKNIKIEKDKPDNYEKKSSFETEEEYCNRHLSYGYMKVEQYELSEEDYDISNKKFKVNLNFLIDNKEINNPTYYIEINRDEAKDLYKNSENRYIYEKFVDANKGFSFRRLLGLKDKQILKKTLSIIHQNKIYILKINDSTLMTDYIAEDIKKSTNMQVTTVINGSMWQDGISLEENKMDWDEAQQYCQNLRLDGYTNWRVPYAGELQGLFSKKSQLKDNPTASYWSSSQHAEKNAFLVGFNRGNTYPHFKKDNKYYVRCMRDIK